MHKARLTSVHDGLEDGSRQVSLLRVTVEQACFIQEKTVL